MIRRNQPHRKQARRDAAAVREDTWANMTHAERIAYKEATGQHFKREMWYVKWYVKSASY